MGLAFEKMRDARRRILRIGYDELIANGLMK